MGWQFCKSGVNLTLGYALTHVLQALHLSIVRFIRPGRYLENRTVEFFGSWCRLV
jgi:hypothetical protein